MFYFVLLKCVAYFRDRLEISNSQNEFLNNFCVTFSIATIFSEIIWAMILIMFTINDSVHIKIRE